MRADCSWLMHRRLTIVTRNARGERTLSSSDCCQRMKVSCSMYSASDTLPNIRYAIENSRLRYWSNVARRMEFSALVVDVTSGTSVSFLLRIVRPSDIHARVDQSPAAPHH